MSDRGQGNSPLHWALMGRNQVTTQLKISSREIFYCIIFILNLMLLCYQHFYENNFVNFYIDQIVRVLLNRIISIQNAVSLLVKSKKSTVNFHTPNSNGETPLDVYLSLVKFWV